MLKLASFKFSMLLGILGIATLLSSLSGCALFGSELDEAAKAAGKLVTFYCDNIPNDAVREQFRTAVNEHAAPNAVNVTCANGSAPLTVPSTNTGAHVMPTTNPHEIERLKKRDAEIAATAANTPQSNNDGRIAALESRVGSLESTSSSHESRITSLERRTG